MKVLLSWLREFAPFEGDAVMLGEEMSDLGMAVESLVELGQGLDGIVVAKVLDLRPHPDADKIQLVDVDVGDGDVLQICCGAFNMAIGDLVPLATLGTVMPEGMKIERRKLRGQWSNGMLCSSKEMGLGDDHAGIHVLAPHLDIGADIKEALGIVPDVLYDLEINPNRPDAMSVAGVARDLAARLKVPFTQIAPSASESSASTAGRASVEIVDPDLCGRFLVRVIDDIAIGPSPAWLANRLVHLGMRPINCVVDASNYVMLELGQPNHTYDLAKVPNGALRVRWAPHGETIRTLDDIERTLTSGDGVIADEHDHAIGIAGVMGGASTEISNATTSVLLEMAWWDPMSIARSSARLGLRSEASMRFERGADPEIVELAALRFAELLAPTGAALAAGTVDARGNLPSRAPVRVRTQRVNDYLGTTFEDSLIADLLAPIGFQVNACTPVLDGVHDIVVPSFRPDTTTETDIIEEVARHYSYSRLPRSVPAGVRTGSLSARQADRRFVRQTMVGLGLHEAMPLPFLSPHDIARAGLSHHPITVTNPLDADESVLRTSLRPGLLKAIAYNESHRQPAARLFEVGKVFLRPVTGNQLPDEREQLGVVLAGDDAIGAVDVWHVLADALAVVDRRIEQVMVEGLHPTRSAHLVVSEVVVGAVGEIDPSVLEAFGINQRVGWLEVDLDQLLELPHGDRAYRPISRYPSSDIDLAFEVNESVPAAAIEETIAIAAGPMLVDLSLFDAYRGQGLPADHRSLAFALRLQARDRTLTDRDISEVRDHVVAAVEAEHQAKLRG